MYCDVIEENVLFVEKGILARRVTKMMMSWFCHQQMLVQGYGNRQYFCVSFVSYLFLIKSSRRLKVKQLCVTVACLHFSKPTFIPNLFHALWLWKRIVYKMKNDEIIVVNLLWVFSLFQCQKVSRKDRETFKTGKVVKCLVF